ncbi:Speckle-type POZ protein [Orchesella cincta]|uniref:Speckle-type POZ protein n=1 Tax=Orchesella cincta TaxID=48709 RepID=A0A1D2M351_ORCCI|nr:Speckle-type POZ protein [Orchesella cincta]
MGPTKRRAYLLKDREINFPFEKNRDSFVQTDHRTPTTLYIPDADSFVKYPGESYNDEHIVQITNAISKEAVENSTNSLIELSAHFDKFYQKVKVLATVKIPEGFVKSLLNYVAEPKISIQGTYELIWHNDFADGDPWAIWEDQPDQAQEFYVPAIPLKENQPIIESNHFSGTSRMTHSHLSKDELSDVRMKYSIILEWNDYSVDVEAVKVDVLDKLYTDKMLASCVLVASNGEEFPAHRCILAAQSTVFHTMFKSEFRESQTNRVELKDITKSCLEVLLAYFYGRDINLKQIPDKIATQLIQAAHKYDISGLERLMLQLLLNKPTDWFTMDNMIVLYHFTVNVDGDKFQLLTDKLLNIMKRYPQQLKTSEAYQNFMKDHPENAAELFIKLLEHDSKMAKRIKLI